MPRRHEAPRALRVSRPDAPRRGEDPLVLEAIGEDKIRVNASTLDHPLTILAD
jgi:hypothetical protein